MKKFIECTMVIDEAGATVKKRGFLKITLIFILVYLFCVIPISLFSAVFFLIFSIFNEEASSDLINQLETSSTASNLISLFLCIFIIIIPIIYCTKFERRRLFTMGFTKKGSVGEYIYGLIIGFVMFASAFGIIYLCSGFDSVATNAEISWGMIILLFLGYMIQGMSEEVLLRGYYMVSLATSCNVSTAIFASSCVFTLLHVGNEGINIVGLINVFLFGIFAALYFVRRGNIWGIAALHTMWNFAQGNIFGCLVSGNNSGKSVVTSQINDSLSLINGGKFGPEGGVAVAAVLVLGIMVLYFTKNKERTSEADYK